MQITSLVSDFLASNELSQSSSPLLHTAENVWQKLDLKETLTEIAHVRHQGALKLWIYAQKKYLTLICLKKLNFV